MPVKKHTRRPPKAPDYKATGEKRAPQIKKVCNIAVEVCEVILDQCSEYLENQKVKEGLPPQLLANLKVALEYIGSQRKIKLDEYRTQQRLNLENPVSQQNIFTSLTTEDLMLALKSPRKE